jgi:hypothetical protein
MLKYKFSIESIIKILNILEIVVKIDFIKLKYIYDIKLKY